MTASTGLTSTCSGLLPVTEHKATGEGEQEEDDCECQFKLLVLVLVGESVGGTIQFLSPVRNVYWDGTYFDCLLRRVTLTFPKTRARYNLNRKYRQHVSSHLTTGDQIRESNPFFFGRNASMSQKESARSLMASWMPAMDCSSSGLRFTDQQLPLHLIRQTLISCFTTSFHCSWEPGQQLQAEGVYGRECT